MLIVPPRLTSPFPLQGVQLSKKGHVLVDPFQETTAPGVYALGDVCGKAELTPGRLCRGARRR